jgi:uncharacterized membrane protein YkvA (DUF1232 family)
MLYRMLDEVCGRIDRLNVQAEAPRMLQQIELARPDFRNRFLQGAPEGTVELLSQAIAAGILMRVKEIPDIVRSMTSTIKSSREQPALRCAVAGVLCYLVQPHDLVPDAAPGGYGFVDDSVILRAGRAEYLRGRANVEEDEKFANMAASIVPLDVLPALQLTIQGMSAAVQLLNLLPSAIAEMTLQQAIANPLQMAAPAAPAGFTPAAAPSYGTGSWSGGAYFEGGNVVVPGGPSLIDGQLFIPD